MPDILGNTRFPHGIVEFELSKLGMSVRARDGMDAILGCDQACLETQAAQMPS